MTDRAHDHDIVSNSHPDAVILRSPPNWTAVAFFGALGALHLTIATSAFLNSRWGAHMSVIFGTIFCGIGVISLFARHQIEIAPADRRIRLRTGIGRFSYRSEVPFCNVLSVRVIVSPRHCDSSVSIICAHRDIEIPPTDTPRQQALALALALNVRLIKVYAEPMVADPAERIARLQHDRSESESL
jgi:hypothetical protein